MIKQKEFKNCAECDKEFKLYKSTDKFCSIGCASIAAKDKNLPKAPRVRIKQMSDKRKERLAGRSEIDVFREIWEERKHVSELTGDKLPYGPDNIKMWVKQFLHVLNKGRFSTDEHRLNKRNILLGTPDEHDDQDNYEVFKKRKIELLNEVYINPKSL